MSKLVVTILTLTLITIFTACGSGGGSSDTTNENSNTQSSSDSSSLSSQVSVESFSSEASSQSSSEQRTISAPKVQYSYVPKSDMRGNIVFAPTTPNIVDDYLYIGTGNCVKCGTIDHNYLLKLTIDLKDVWAFDVGRERVLGKTLLDHDKNIYFLTSDSSNRMRFLYSITDDGNLNWKREFEGGKVPEIMEIAMSNIGNLIVSNSDDTAIAFDREGNQIFKLVFAQSNDNNLQVLSDKESQVAYFGGLSAPTVDSNDNIYFIGRSYNTLYLLCLDNAGNVNWVTDYDLQQGYDVYSTPVVAEDNIIFGFGQKAYSLKKATGEKNWEFRPDSIKGDFRGTPTIDEVGNVYFGEKEQDDATMYAIKADGSGLIWERYIGADIYPAPILGNNRVVYVGSEYNQDMNAFFGLDMDTGEIHWSWNYSMRGHGAPVFYDGLMYLTDFGDEKFGKLLFALEVGATDYLEGAIKPDYR